MTTSFLSRLFNAQAQLSSKATALIAALFGILSSLAFNTPMLFALCWITFGVIFTLVSNNKKGRVFTTLLCFFMPFYMGTYFWFINLYPLDFAGLNNNQSIGVIICALVLIPAIHTLIMSCCIYLCVKLTKATGLTLCFVFSFAYCFGEFLQGIGPLAFPWSRLFITQISALPILQSASLFGSYFITFIIIFCNCLLAYGLFGGLSKRNRNIYIACAIGFFTANLVFGTIRLATIPKPHKSVTAVAMQGNMSSYEKWSGGVTDSALKIYSELCQTASQKACANTQIILVTPETAFPLTLSHDGNYSTSYDSANACLQQISNQTGAYLVVGAFSDHKENSYNSQFLYSPNNNTPREFYQKHHLVPFGEYLPFRPAFELLLPSLAELNLFGSELSAPNTQMELCDIAEIKIGGMICFDSIFSDVSRNQVRNGARLLVLSTNDSWYKTSRALDQHLAHAQMRAIENGVSVIRSANTGISANITPTGNVLDKLEAQKRGSVISTLPIYKNITLYNYIGDIILPVGIIFVIAIIIKNRLLNK